MVTERRKFLVGLTCCAGAWLDQETLNIGSGCTGRCRISGVRQGTEYVNIGSGDGVDLGVALNALMAKGPHEIDTMDNFLES